MTTITQSISSLGSVPTTADPSTFDSRADTFLGTSLPTLRTEINTWAGQANTVAGEVNANAVAAAASEAAAAASEAAAIAVAGASVWVSGQSYSSGDAAYSPVDFLTYRANTATSGTTDPSLSADWDLISGNVTTTSAQTLTNKTLSGVVLNDGYTEEVFAVTGTTPALSPTDGSIQTWTLSDNSTPTAGTWAAGQSVTLMVDDGTAYAITWSSVAVTWKTDGGSAPTLNTSGETAIQLWKVGTTIYGARVGNA